MRSLFFTICHNFFRIFHQNFHFSKYHMPSKDDTKIDFQMRVYEGIESLLEDKDVADQAAGLISQNFKHQLVLEDDQVPSTRDLLVDTCSYHNIDQIWWYVLYDQKHVVGICAGTLYPSYEGVKLFLLNLCVDISMQGRGIGTHFLVLIARQCVSKDIRKVSISFTILCLFRIVSKCIFAHFFVAAVTQLLLYKRSFYLRKLQQIYKYSTKTSQKFCYENHKIILKKLWRHHDHGTTGGRNFRENSKLIDPKVIGSVDAKDERLHRLYKSLGGVILPSNSMSSDGAVQRFVRFEADPMELLRKMSEKFGGKDDVQSVRRPPSVQE